MLFRSRTLVDRGYKLLIETSGAYSVAELPKETHIVMDIKCPGSKMQHRNYWQNLEFLKPTDDIKFVIADRYDFDWACDIIGDKKLNEVGNVLLSPAWGLCQPKDLVEWTLTSKIKARINLQQHKFIWGARARGV